MEVFCDIVKDSVSAFTLGSGSSNGGNAVLDFGAHPGAQETKLAITGQTGILSTSKVFAQIRCVDSVDHSADEHLRETISIVPAEIVPGTGFTIYAFKQSKGLEADTFLYGQYNVSWMWI